MTAQSDLGVRTLSAIVMVAVAGTALWLGGWVFAAFVLAVGLGVLWEWWGLASKIAKTPFGAMLWMAAGVGYVSFAIFIMNSLREWDILFAALPIALVVSVDVGAYVFGRTFGGPKIAPFISPSKTWSGLFGGSLSAFIIIFYVNYIQDYIYFPYQHYIDRGQPSWLEAALIAVVMAALIAIVAQAGDFFESWMKRRAGVKDSGNLIPGHGGLFDRLDGLLAVLFVSGIIMTVAL